MNKMYDFVDKNYFEIFILFFDEKMVLNSFFDKESFFELKIVILFKVGNFLCFFVLIFYF